MGIFPQRRSSVNVGDRFHSWTVLGVAFVVPTGDGKSKSMHVVECDCGAVEAVFQRSLKIGDSKACGNCHHHDTRRSHGACSKKACESDRVIYNRWRWMRDRCHRPDHRDYKNYGGRGISVCQEWREDFFAFRDWAVLNGFRPDLTIDREHVDRNYTPENCRWIANSAQQRNRTNNRVESAFGESKLVCEWVEDPRCQVSDATLRTRLHNGWSLEQAMKAPVKRGRPKKVNT